MVDLPFALHSDLSPLPDDFISKEGAFDEIPDTIGSVATGSRRTSLNPIPNQFTVRALFDKISDVTCICAVELSLPPGSGVFLKLFTKIRNGSLKSEV
jgi:hypothetical protein